jgi:hypothetical protein
MPWPARRRWELRTKARERPPDEPDAPEDVATGADLDLTPAADGSYTRAQMLAGNRVSDRWKRGVGPPPTHAQRAAYLAYRAQKRRPAPAATGEPTEEDQHVRREKPEITQARERMDAAGVDWPTVREWATRTGRWSVVETATVREDAVDAYLAANPLAPADPVAAEPVQPDPSRFDDLLSDPEFIATLAEHCRVYGPQAPPDFAEALALLGAGARRLLELTA